MDLAERFKERMSALGLNQKEVADRSGLSQVSVHKVIVGTTRKLDNPVQYARALECDPVWLVTGKGEAHEDYREPESPRSLNLTNEAQDRLLDLFGSLTEAQQAEILSSMEKTHAANDALFRELSKKRE